MTYRLNGDPKEGDIQALVLRALSRHPRVAWIERYNSGAVKAGGRYVRYNTNRGQSDLMGQLKTGELLAIEIKKPGERPTFEQQAFLDTVVKNGGCAGWVDKWEDAVKLVDCFK